MKCPLCKETMVPSRIEDEETNWTYGWLCGCNEDIRKKNAELLVQMQRGVSDVAAKKLLESMRQIFSVEKKSNAEIADLLIEHLWGDYEVDSRQSALLEVTIERLRH